MFAQIGLGGDPTGGIIVLLIGGMLGGLGLILCAVGGIRFFLPRASRRRSLLLLLLGMLLASPAAWFAWEVFGPDIPRDKFWDFSTSRGIAQLQEPKDVGSHYFQGNIRSTIKLAGGRQWSGHAYLVAIRTKSGQVSDIHWQSLPDAAAPVYEQTGRILKGLGLPAQELESWYGKVSRGEQASFTAVMRSSTDASIEVQVRGSVKEKSWVTHVNVWWAEGNR
jgi:hypothetical protein